MSADCLHILASSGEGSDEPGQFFRPDVWDAHELPFGSGALSSSLFIPHLPLILAALA